MIKDKKIVRNFIWNTIGSGLSSFNSVFFLMVVTRINKLEDAGIFSICVTTAFILYVFAIYSGRNCHVTDIKHEIKDKDYIVSRVMTCMGMLVITLGFILLNQSGGYKNTILLSLCLWKALEAFADVFYAILQKNDKLYMVGKSLTMKSVIGIVLFALIDYLTKNLIYACMSLPIVTLFIFIGYDLPHTIPFIAKEEKATKKNIWNIYKNEFFLFAGSFLTMYILNAPKYAIEQYLTNDIQAIYGIILMPASILPLFAQFVIAPLMNDLTNLYKEKKWKQMRKLENKITYMIMGFGVVAVLLGYRIGIPILSFLYGLDLTDYAAILVLILIAYIMYAIGTTKTVILTIQRKIKEQFVAYLTITVIAFLCSNRFIHSFGEKGIIVSYGIIMLAYYLLFMGLTKYQYHKNDKKEVE